MSNIKKRLTLAEKIKIARKSVGLSQKDLGKVLNVSDKAVSAYEVGRAVPPVGTLKEISKVTYKPFGYFINEDADDKVDLEQKIEMIERELREVKELLIKNNKKK